MKEKVNSYFYLELCYTQLREKILYLWRIGVGVGSWKLDLRGDIGGNLPPEKESGFSFSFYDVLTWVFQKLRRGKMWARSDTCKCPTALRPLYLDSASQITPSWTPEASKSIKWFISYANFKNFARNGKYFFTVKKFLKLVELLNQLTDLDASGV